jgi:dTDP-4-dehydrorhamnose 3,5-epimerase
MIFTETKLKGAFLIEVKRLEDERGFFGRTWCQRELAEHGLNATIAQANISHNSQKGTLRGMHQQLPPYAETKIVSCSRGAIYDVIIDMREHSDTYRQWLGVELSADNYRMLYVPEGFAHGFITLQDDTDVHYLISQFYTPGAERPIRWNDPAFDIAWPLQPQVISAKDLGIPDFDSIAVRSVEADKS